MSIVETHKDLLLKIADGHQDFHELVVEDPKRMDHIPALREAGLITSDAGRVALKLKGWLAIETPKKGELLEVLKRIFPAIRQWHADRKSEEWNSIELAKSVGLDHKRVYEALEVLLSSASFFGSSGGDFQTGRSFSVTMTVLRYLSFEDLQNQLFPPPAPPKPTASQLAPSPRPVEKWKFERNLREGGQGRARVVKDPTGKLFVKKELKNLDRKERFVREVNSMLGLSHPNIVRIVDHELEVERPFFVMEYCERGDIEGAATTFSSDPALALDVFEQVVEAINFSHANKVIHRDIKPANILIRDFEWNVAVCDFGLCHLEGDSRLTETNEQVGPRFFMPPECESGRADKITAAGDVFMLGKLLYWMLSGGRNLFRERHRDPAYDLCALKDRILYEHFNLLLDGVLLENPVERLPTSEFLNELRKRKSLFLREMNIAPSKKPQRCIYCGLGFYRVVAKTNAEVGNFGLVAIGNPKWRVQACNNCGNVQLFRTEMGQMADRRWDGV